MDPIFALDLRLPTAGSRDLLRALHRQMRAAIVDGRLKPGLRLPPTRSLAAGLAISRNTAVGLYDLLLSEGYLVARRGSGTFVAEALTPARAAAPRHGSMDGRLAPLWRGAPKLLPATGLRKFRADFGVGLPDKASFPFAIWRRLSARALRGLSKVPAAYVEAAGRPALRAAIANHVSFARAVACGPDDVVVTNGAQQAFDLLARILVTPGRSMVAVESPGYPPLCAAFAAAGARIEAVPVDGEGLIVERLPAATRVICVTPSHQFPLGVAMSLRRRAALLEFARRRGAVIIEDDYDGEFRLAGRPLDALQTLDRDASVFYVGTFSKSLFPALRLGYVVAPGWARAALIAAKQVSDWHGAVLAQDTLAAFIGEGHLARHVRKMRRVYGERRAILQQALADLCGERLTLYAGECGLHLAARLDTRVNASTLGRELALQGVGLQALARYAVGRAAPNGIAFGYGLVQTTQIEAGVRLIAKALR
jgi:GntR family transcriptional regulator / MocR family aminotransferase